MKQTLKTLFLSLTLFCTMLIAAPKDNQLAFPVLTQDFLALEPSIDANEFYLMIQGPNGQNFDLVFDGLDVPYVHLSDLGDLSEGVYQFNLVARPILSADAQDFLQANRNQMEAVSMKTMRDAGFLPDVPMTMSGNFRIHDGAFYVSPAEMDEVIEVAGKTDLTASEDKGDGVSIATDQDDPDRAQVYSTDLVVKGSQCLGTDCVNAESYGADTLRLKENNLRIHFDDTSSSGSFPSNDWRITINDSGNGGDSYFAINDVTGNKTPFQIVAGAPNNSLVVDAQGDVGVGTNAPVMEIHVQDGDSPTIRLHQDGSSGWSSHVWDMVGNEANFFIRDVTGGGDLPFRIKPGAPENSIYMDSDTQIGFYTQTPDSTMHLKTSTGSTKFHVQESNATAADRDMFEISNNGGSRILINNTDNSETWKLTTALNSDSFNITFDGSGQRELELSESGNLTIANNIVAGGTVTGSSDRNIKENFKAINHYDILDKVTSLEVTEWNYISDQSETRHIGPMAQDFYAAFGVGMDDKHISMVDVDGIALASIKALNEKLNAKDSKIETLEQQNQKLQEQNQAINEKLSRIEAMLQRMEK